MFNIAIEFNEASFLIVINSKLESEENQTQLQSSKSWKGERTDKKIDKNEECHFAASFCSYLLNIHIFFTRNDSVIGFIGHLFRCI